MSYRIEDVLEGVQRDAPSPRTSTDDIIAGARRIRSRRRVAAVAGAGGAAAVVVALVTALTGAPQQAAPLPPAAPQPSPSADAPRFTQPDGFTATLGEYRVGIYRAGPVDKVTEGWQRLPVFREGATPDLDENDYSLADAAITVYKPGVYDPATFGEDDKRRVTYGPSEQVTVAGGPGLVREVTYRIPKTEAARRLFLEPDPDPSAKQLPVDTYVRTAVAWEYADDAWATLIPALGMERFPRADVLELAEKLSPGTARQLRAPYELGWLPEGVQVVGVTQHAPGESAVLSEVVLHKGPLSAADRAGPVDETMSGGLLRVGAGAKKAFCGVPACVVMLDKTHFAQFQGVGKAITAADAQRILAGLKVTEPADQSAWLPVPTRP